MNKKTIAFWSCLAVLCIFMACLPTAYDYDLFARLIVGENIIEHGIFPFRDFLSYTPTHPWFDHEWGSGVIFYLLLKYFGAAGFVIFYALAIFGISFFVIKTQKLQRHSFPTSILFITLFLIFFALCNHNLVRCQLITFFLFSMFIYILEKNRKCRTSLIWLIPPVIIFWNNVHGGVAAGIGLIFMYLIGAIIERKKVKKLLTVAALSMPLLAINPYGIKYLNFLISATTMKRKFVVEWWPFYTTFHSTATGLACIFGMLPSFVNSFKNKRFDITKLIVISVTLIEGLLHIKLLSLALIAIASLCYNDIVILLTKWKKLLKKTDKLLYIAIPIIFIVLFPLLSPQTPRVDFSVFPYKEVEFLKVNNIKGNIVTPFALGSYVSYKLYPDNLIYLDGRYEEVYNDKEFYTMGDFELADTDNWNKILKNYDTQILMIRKQIPAYQKMIKEKNWVHVYDGHLCGIFLRNDKLKDIYIQPEDNISYYRKTAFDGNFGTKIRKIYE